jgi:hypothetical protein
MLDYVGSEVVTAAVMNSIIFWDITPVHFQRTTRRYIPKDSTLNVTLCRKFRQSPFMRGFQISVLTFRQLPIHAL